MQSTARQEETVRKDVPPKVLVAMSGGVDSSIAAMLLAENGVEVTGVTFRLPFYGAESGMEGGCCGTAGIKDARDVCRRIGIKHYVLDYREKFEQTVLENFRTEYCNGRTPNPCIRCNDWLKFGSLLDTALAMDIPAVATGHYVRKLYNVESGRYELLTGPKGEDQSYFLFTLSQNQLARAVFPLGELTKKQVRFQARRTGLGTHNRPKSQDLCFLAGGRYGELLRKKHPELLAPGEIRHVDGRKLGTHRGIALYTVGQRKGLGLSWNEPLYVVEIDPQRNRLIVGEKEHVRERTVSVGELNWVSVAPSAGGPMRAGVKIRFRHPPAAASIANRGGGRARVQFDEAQLAPTPGQAAVFYCGERLLGGGFIEKTPSGC